MSTLLDPKLVRYARNRAAALRRESFSRVMLSWITATGRTQVGLGRELGIKQGSVARWCAGTSSPTAEHLAALRALGFEPPADADDGNTKPHSHS